MLQLCCCLLLLCHSANAGAVLIARAGDSVTFKCSSAGCKGAENCTGMYMYHDYDKLHEVLYYPSGGKRPMRRLGYEDRTRVDGRLEEHNITINNLTKDDAGVYRCTYKSIEHPTECDCHVLFITPEDGPASKQICTVDAAQCPSSGPSESTDTSVSCAGANNKVLLIAILCTLAASVFLTLVFSQLIVPGVKQGIGRRRMTTHLPNENVYEIMTKNGLQPADVVQQQPPDLQAQHFA